MKDSPVKIAVLISAAIIVAVPYAADAALHIVRQINLTFSPDALSVVEGDTVRWVQSGGSHTVTNGTGSSDPNVGTLFDAPLDSSTPTFEYVFTTAGTYPYFCRPHEPFSMNGVITVDVATGIRTPDAVPALLGQNRPNPFSGVTDIEYSIVNGTRVKLAVYDIRGRLIQTLEDRFRPAGSYRAAWDGRNAAGERVPTGVYYYRLETSAVTLSKKLVLLK